MYAKLSDNNWYQSHTGVVDTSLPQLRSNNRDSPLPRQKRLALTNASTKEHGLLPDIRPLTSNPPPLGIAG